MKSTAKSKKARSGMAPPQGFTVRDLNRQPAKVLAACDRDGAVRICARDGRSYSLTPELPKADRTVAVESLIARRRRLRERLRAAGFVPPSAAEIEHINRLIAGEE